MKRNNKRGFTLVEILIVVIILGILAAIVIPQFTNASTSARTSSVQSTLQSIRSQIELYKIQHNDTPPAATGLWTSLTGPTDTTGNTSTTNNATFTWGPYLQQIPKNPLNGNTGYDNAGAANTNVGWYYTVSNNVYTVYARDTSGNTITTY
jgi:general secretion pathway protein G